MRQLHQHVGVALNLTHAPSRDIRFLRSFVRKVAKLLGQNAPSSQVRRDFRDLLSEIREALQRYPESDREAALKHMLATSRHFGSKLFTCYAHPEIPRTDNGLEGSFRTLRRHERVITGHKSTARRTVRDGPFLLPALERARRSLPSVEELSRVSEELWRGNLQKIRAQRARYDRPRRLRQDLPTSLRALVKRCRQIPRVRSP